MFKKLITLCMCLLLLSSTFAFAGDVYVTKTGKTYHSDDCRLVANKNTTAISTEEAEAKNLRACKKCIGKLQAKANTKSKNINAEDAVYITKSGKKFHKQDCRLIKSRDTNAISLEDAQAKKMSACKKCFAEELAKIE